MVYNYLYSGNTKLISREIPGVNVTQNNFLHVIDQE